MPLNRNALIRYKTIDNCLRNRFRKWTLEDLITACSDALYEYEGIEKGVSKRTVQGDIQLMRSDKLGYNAPIVVLEKKYYTYEDKDYSITNIPLTAHDLERLSEVMELLKQFKGFSHFQDVGGMLQKLEDKIHTAKSKQDPIIDFEKNENLKGLHQLDAIYQAILKAYSLELTYQSFKAREASVFVFYPQFLKEYRNRWFVVGARKGHDKVLTLALDRIQAVKKSLESYQKIEDIRIQTYYENVVGVTVTNSRPQNVHIWVNRENAPYVLTKPLHHSQYLIEERADKSIVIGIKVITNLELQRLILGFGAGMEVLQPNRLRELILKHLRKAVAQYE